MTLTSDRAAGGPMDGAEVLREDFALDTGKTAELIAQLLARTPGGKLTQSEIAEAIATVGELYSAAATLELWKTGQIEFGWDREESELTLCSVESARDNAASETGRVVFRSNDG